jgi:hypothetical protein
MGPWTFVKQEPLSIRSTTMINPVRWVSGVLISATDITMDGCQRSPIGTAACIEVRGHHRSSSYVALGATVSGGKQCGRGSHPYPGFNSHTEIAARSHHGELVVFKLGAGGALLRWASIPGEGRGSTRRLKRYSSA